MNISIKQWFPKPIYSVDTLLTDQLEYYENTIHQYINNSKGSKRNDWLANLEFQTEPYLHTDPKFQPLVDQIYIHSKNFLVELGYHEYIENIKITNMWAVVSHNGDYIAPHVHPHSILSGVFYIKKYSDSTITFYNDITSMMPQPTISTEYNYPCCSYECNPGTMLLWKSDFLHGTKKQLSGEKIAVSFNLSCT